MFFFLVSAIIQLAKADYKLKLNERQQLKSLIGDKTEQLSDLIRQKEQQISSIGKLKALMSNQKYKLQLVNINIEECKSEYNSIGEDLKQFNEYLVEGNYIS